MTTDRGRTDPADEERELAERVRARLQDTQRVVRERLDEPIAQATRVTRRTLGWFPVRVWRLFLQRNGLLLAAGMSYQSLFAIFAVLYLAFAAVGLWLGGSPQAVQGLIDLINRYIPGLIGGESSLVSTDQVQDVASGGRGLLGVTGAVAAIVVIWTAIGFVTYARRAVRDIFGLPYDSRSYVLLKARDFLAALVFGVALLLGAVVGSFTTWAIDLVWSLLGLDGDSFWSSVSVRGASLLVAFVINSAALAALYRFLIGAALRWRRILPGSLMGGAALAVVQLGAGLLLLYAPRNPLLATFTAFIGFLLLFRVVGVVILVASAWIAVAAADRHVAIVPTSDAERRAIEREARLVVARVDLRRARQEQTEAPWWRSRAARRRVAQAELEVEQLEAEDGEDVGGRR